MKQRHWIKGFMVAVGVGAGMCAAWAAGINAPAGATDKAYHFSVTNSEPGYPSQEVWVAGDKFRVETTNMNKAVVYICDGANLLAYAKGDQTAEKHPMKMAGQLKMWTSMYNAKNPAFTAPEAKENAMCGKVNCTVQSFNAKGQRGEITITEWTDPASGLVLKREVNMGGRDIVTTLEPFEAMASADAKWFELPAGVSAKEKWMPRPGVAASDFTLKTYDTGETVKLSDYKGKKVVLLNFFATWCGPCRMETPGFVKVYEEYKDKDVAFLSVDAGEKVKTPTEAVDKVGKFVKEYGVQWPVVMDEMGKISTTYQVKGIPTNLVIDKDGVIKYYANVMQEADLKKQLDRALKKGAPGAFQDDPEE